MIVLKLTAMTQHAVATAATAASAPVATTCFSHTKQEQHQRRYTYYQRKDFSNGFEPDVVCPHPCRDIAEAPNLTKATAAQDRKQPSASHQEALTTCASPPEDDDAFLPLVSESSHSLDHEHVCSPRHRSTTGDITTKRSPAVRPRSAPNEEASSNAEAAPRKAASNIYGPGVTSGVSHAKGGVVRRRLAGVVGRRRGRQRGSGRGLLGQRPRVAESVLSDHAGRGDEVLRQDLRLRLVALLPAQHNQLLAVATRPQKLEDEHFRSASGDGHGKLGDISNRGGVERVQDHIAQSVVAHVARMGEHLG
eukprot:CAMPEP_0177437902 /NCGR_PEP_ID=MMETSP0369-20130122/2454_1 /TAXON_ID=447022 ORGANISM="Scrippsiella hangoei-like, Strain SHHI-4" /NCGR_SAMPLE_ID=MMETSP0369 /ASSEMBLY_ACC=CAM_ASM_000364 /LENGTH=306 /DNA_ID=CAMNT_0018909403 /DNA_START=31 /DNA_END=952 /DNA_ORIENTATION=+